MIESESECGEVEEVLAVLGQLAQKVSSPMIRMCLETARDDIAHLTTTGEVVAAEADDLDAIEGD
jgi:hypothetical protein